MIPIWCADCVKIVSSKNGSGRKHVGKLVGMSSQIENGRLLDEFFDLVTLVVREAESKEAGSPDSRKTVESICGKLEHCIENIDKLRYLVEDAIGARDLAHDDLLTEYD